MKPLRCQSDDIELWLVELSCSADVSKLNSMRWQLKDIAPGVYVQPDLSKEEREQRRTLYKRMLAYKQTCEKPECWSIRWVDKLKSVMQGPQDCKVFFTPEEGPDMRHKRRGVSEPEPAQTGHANPDGVPVDGDKLEEGELPPPPRRGAGGDGAGRGSGSGSSTGRGGGGSSAGRGEAGSNAGRGEGGSSVGASNTGRGPGAQCAGRGGGGGSNPGGASTRGARGGSGRGGRGLRDKDGEWSPSSVA